MGRFLYCWVMLAAAAAIGCSREAPRGSVTGTVTHKGAPVVGMAVYFEEESSGGGPTVNLKDDGSFTMATYQGAGLPVGKYKVAIVPRMLESADEMPLAGKKVPKTATPSPIPEKYLKTATSGLVIEVKNGDNPAFDFDLK